MTDDYEPNIWERVGERQIVAPRKRILKGIETRRRNRQQEAQDKALKERDILFGMWTKWHAERRKELQKGPCGVQAIELATFLDNMTLSDGGRLIELVESGPWKYADADTRFLAFEMVSLSIIALREKNDMLPFDDPLPDEEDDVFQQVKRLLNKRKSDQ